MNASHLIFGIHVTDRLVKATEVQKLFSEYGCHIKTRIGLHDVGPDFCSPSGVVILEMYGDPVRCQELATKLKTIEGIEIQTMEFKHPA